MKMAESLADPYPVSVTYRSFKSVQLPDSFLGVGQEILQILYTSMLFLDSFEMKRSERDRNS